MQEKHSPLVLWDYGVKRRALIMNATANDLFQLRGTNPHTATFGDEIDISNICQSGGINGSILEIQLWIFRPIKRSQAVF